MDSITLTVHFEEPFWVGVFEHYNNGKYSVAKIIFGAEPTAYELYYFILGNYYKLIFSKPLTSPPPKPKSANPKRRQREIKRSIAQGIGTKAQQTLKKQQTENKQTNKKQIKLNLKLKKQIKFECKQFKKRKKQQGH